ncbi:TraB/GumN family protein [Alkaliphilus serpentinus]|uniref:TraB/GumN family protein n=1 Tax=Alkaliphilus serpentinus TaxID=1482731 RepID=A0A833MAA2_9FIRM|nr:TraB/GumN family protein [Alkaliphilus serpentinus]KAB3531780.1 TraB/GumN family protein [Alkaliphilus serpentinus]
MKLKKLVLCIIVIVLTMAVIQTPLLYTLANETLEIEHYEMDLWAVEEVGMAKLYSFADESILHSFRNHITKQELTNLSMNLYGKLTENIDNQEALNIFNNQLVNTLWKEGFDATTLATREEVGHALYYVIKTSAPELDYTVLENTNHKDIADLGEEAKKAIGYIVDKGILRGKGNNNLDLRTNCSRQEILVLAKRVYEHVIHETGRASKGYFYKVTGENSQVYILGSIHIADISIYPLHKEIEEAFSIADYLAVEADVTNMNDDIEYMQQKAVFLDGTTIDMVIAPETYKLYAEKLEEYGFTPEVYNILKPWYAAMLVQNLSLEEVSFSAGLGIDMYFLSKGQGNKEILEIEGLPFQVDLFDNFSAEIQEAFLIEALSSSEKTTEGSSAGVDSMKEMLLAWKHGDVEALETILETTDKSEDANDFNNKFWIERNKNMTEKIISYLSDENQKTYMVIVGAGHLVGETGIVKELIELGYTLEMVQ